MSDTDADTKSDLRRRIERVYLANHPEEDDPRGALEFFRKKVSSRANEDREVRHYTIWRWVEGERDISTPALRILENLEAEAGIEPEVRRE